MPLASTAPRQIVRFAPPCAITTSKNFPRHIIHSGNLNFLDVNFGLSSRSHADRILKVAMNLLRFSMMVMIAARMGLALASTEMDALPGAAAGKGIEQSRTRATRPNGESFQEALGGIVINQTTTVAGQEFFKQFYALWNDKPLLDFFAITVRERPSARRGNRIVIEYAQRTLFETSLPSSRAGIQSISETAVQISYDSVVDTAVQRLLFREQDLAADEF